jgi:hypothetical protein
MPSAEPNTWLVGGRAASAGPGPRPPAVQTAKSNVQGRTLLYADESTLPVCCAPNGLTPSADHNRLRNRQRRSEGRGNAWGEGLA